MHKWLRVASLVLLVAVNGPAAVPEGAIVHKPRIPVEAPPGAITGSWASSNWSGYALSGSGYTSASGSWIVQQVARGKGSTYSSQWVGIDGFNNSNLIQTGTESDFVNGSARYDAWWEILPAAETVITGMTVRPGDHMNASVTLVSGSSWKITISDMSTGQSFTTTQTYTGPRTSAEWVEEAPTVGGHIATLANYGQTMFDPGAIVPSPITGSTNPGLTAANSGVMIQRGRQVSTPSAPDRDTDGFNMQYGSTAPAAPTT